MTQAITVSQLTRRFGDLVAVDQVSFEVQRGEIFGYLGPNGAGKTTTIKMLTGLLRPTGGTAYIEGRDICRDMRGIKGHIGVVPDACNLYGELTAWDNLTFAADLYRVPRREGHKRAAELLERFGLNEQRDVKAQRLSRGMQRRLTFAMALVHRPGILFLDEPTTALDVRSAAAVRDLIRSLGKEGITIFLTTHYIEEADQLCDRVAIINKGQIVALDAPESLKSSILGVHTVEVSFAGGGNGRASGLGAIPNCDGVTKQGDKYRLYTQEPAKLLLGLVDYAKEAALQVISLNTLKPRLEDVFLQMTTPETETR